MEKIVARRLIADICNLEKKRLRDDVPHAQEEGTAWVAYDRTWMDRSTHSSVTDIKQLLQPTYTIMEKLAAHRLIADLCNLEKKQLRGVALHTQDSTRWGNGLGGWCCLRRGWRGLSFLSFSLGFLVFSKVFSEGRLFWWGQNQDRQKAKKAVPKCQNVQNQGRSCKSLLENHCWGPFGIGFKKVIEFADSTTGVNFA